MSQTVRSEAVAASLGGSGLLRAGQADVGATREHRRRRRLWTLAISLGLPAGYLWYRLLAGSPYNVFALPDLDPLYVMPFAFFMLLILLLGGSHLMAGRSPHVTYRPEQVATRLSDVRGIDPVKEEVVRSLNLFLAHRTFAREMGGTPRRGLLFEGAPGTGKTHLAKAMAGEAGVPFLFVSATAFQSMFYGATARKIRAYFAALRKVARREGGAIGFIEEIDAIAMSRSGLRSSRAVSAGRVGGSRLAGFDVPAYLPAAFAAPASAVHASAISEGTGGVVNELLVQLQSFDQLTGGQRFVGWFCDVVNLLLPAHRQLRKPEPPATNVLLIAATNRADDLDPALLRPGRFDRKLSFELPAKSGRRELIEHFLARRAYDAEIDDSRRDALAAMTQGYTPVMIEHLLDEALVSAVREGRTAMTWSDIEHARLTEEVGLKQPVAYTDRERRLIATHESGHAVVAYLTSADRRLEVLSIIKRKSALGLLAHGDVEEEYTRSRAQMTALVQIAMAGMAAEELWFGDASTGPGGDLLYATNVAAEMVGSVGMAGSLISYAAVQNSALTDTNIVGRVLADPQGRAKVETLLEEQKGAALELLDNHRHLVEALRDALLDREELIGAEITEVLQGAQRAHDAKVVPVRRPRPGAPGASVGKPRPAVVDLSEPERVRRS